jgi:hypothetical protein
MSELIQVVIKDDDDGHSFVIPFFKEEQFDKLLEQGSKDDYEAFNEEFGEYRASGAIDIPLFAQIGYQAAL